MPLGTVGITGCVIERDGDVLWMGGGSGGRYATDMTRVHVHDTAPGHGGWGLFGRIVELRRHISMDYDCFI